MWQALLFMRVCICMCGENMGFSLTSFHTDFWVVLLFSLHLQTSTCTSKSWAFLVCIKSTLLLDSTIFCLRFQLSGLLPCFLPSLSTSGTIFFFITFCLFPCGFMLFFPLKPFYCHLSRFQVKVAGINTSCVNFAVLSI